METVLQRDGATPLHTQITEALRLQIKCDELKVGENFPSERELAERYGISRMTVRQALRHLRQENLILPRARSRNFRNRPEARRSHQELERIFRRNGFARTVEI